MSKRLMIVLFLALTAVGLLSQRNLSAQEEVIDPNSPYAEQMRLFLADQAPLDNVIPSAASECIGGMADVYPCNNVDLLAHIPLSTMGGSAGNDSWGWTDPLDGKEYALMGMNTGTAFVDMSDPENPIFLGRLPTHTNNSTWRDIKVYEDHAFIVSEASGHGMQVFDLTQLRSVASPPEIFSNTAHYNGFGNAHNIVINEDTGFAYAVGTSTCSGGLHMVNIQNPTSPTNAGCFSSDGYTHDAQCVVYTGPDTVYQGQEICFNANEDTLTIVDVSTKTTPIQISRTPYAGSAYTHQVWVTEDQQYLLLDDELDEINFGHNTRTYIWDIQDLSAPVYMGNYTAAVAAIDHNLYVVGNLAYEANYRSGLRILDISDIANANLTEVAFFDTYPTNDNASFNGAWSNYPYFESGVVVISDIDRGLFLVRPTLSMAGVELTAVEDSLVDWPGETVTYDVTIENSGTVSDTFDLTAADFAWDTALSQSSVFLEPGDTATFQVTVDIPTSANGGDSDIASITATSTVDTAVDHTIELVTVAAGLGVELSSADASLIGDPGTVVTYLVNVANNGTVVDTYDLSATGVWSYTLSNASITVLPGQAAIVVLEVEVPADAMAGDSDLSTVTAVSTTDPTISHNLDLTTVAGPVYGVAAAADDDTLYGVADDVLVFTVQITNSGNTTDTFGISLSSVWAAVASASDITLAAGETGSVEISVTIPSDAVVEDSDSISVMVMSQTDSSVMTDVVLTAVVGEDPDPTGYFIYLPIVVQP